MKAKVFLAGSLSELEGRVAQERASGAPLTIPVWIDLRTPRGCVEILADGFDALLGNPLCRDTLAKSDFLQALALASKARSSITIVAEAKEQECFQDWVDPFHTPKMNGHSEQASYALERLVAGICPDFLVEIPQCGLVRPRITEAFRRGASVIEGVFEALDEKCDLRHSKERDKQRADRVEQSYARRAGQINELILALGATAIWRVQPLDAAAGPKQLWESFWSNREAIELEKVSCVPGVKARKTGL